MHNTGAGLRAHFEQLISRVALAHFRAATVAWKIKLAEIVTVPNSTLARTADASRSCIPLKHEHRGGRVVGWH